MQHMDNVLELLGMKFATSLSDAGWLWQLRRASRLSPFAETSCGNAHGGMQMSKWICGDSRLGCRSSQARQFAGSKPKH